MMLAAIALVGCGRQTTQTANDDDAPRIPGGSGTAEVTYQPNVKVMERRDGLEALIGVSSDGSTLVFDRSRGAVPPLEVGDVVLIKGLLARKVLAIENAGNEIAVLTLPVGLPDLISDGKIRLRAPIRFGAPQPLAARGDSRGGLMEQVFDAIVPQAQAQSVTQERRREAERKGVTDAYGNLAKAPFNAVMSGWDTTYSAEPAPGRLNLKLQMKKSVGPATAVVTGEGYLADFDFSSDIDVERSTVERLELAYKKLNGTMNFKWEVVIVDKGELRGNARIKLPAAISIPLYQYLGGLPLYLEISSAVIIKPAVGAGRSLSTGAFRVTYDGYQNFRVKEGNIDSDGNVTGDIKLIDTQNDSPVATGMVVAFAAPRLELSIGIGKVFKFDGFKDGAAKADKYFDKLVGKVFGPEAVEKFHASPLSVVTAKNIVDAAMGSDAAAFIELVTTSGMSSTGNAVMVPCSRTDLHMAVKFGASAKAFGQSVGDVDKEIFTKDFSRVRPSENRLCSEL